MPTPFHISDRPAESDALGRNHFAKLLAQSIASVGADDGFVIGIEGSWGTGKSTVIGFIKKQLFELDGSDSKPIIVEFNPWMVSNAGGLVDALVTQIAAAIHASVDVPEKSLKAGQKLLSYIGLIKHLKYLKYVPGVSWAGHIAQDAAEIAGTVADGVESAQRALDDVEKLLPNLDLAKRKAEVVEALCELGRNIVVIVDDVDRLPENEIRLIVQAIKAVADFPRTTYLLAYDREIVANALGGGDTAKGQSYLEKIVQVAYPIPPLFRHQLRSFLDMKLKELFAMIGVGLRDYETAIYTTCTQLVTQIVRHPRDIVRLMNRLLLSLPATRNEVNAIDVIVFEAISQRFPVIRDNVHRHPADFIGQSFRGDSSEEEAAGDGSHWAILDSQREDDQDPWEKHLPTIESDRAVARKVCAFLFASASGKSGKVPEDELRMADPDRLARFFRMTSLDSVPEAANIHRDLENPEALEITLENCNGAELTFLLEWIFNYTPSCPTPNAYGSIEKLIDAASNAQTQTTLTDDLAQLFAKVMSRLLTRAPQEERSKCLSLIVNKAPLSISEPVLLEAASEQGKWIIRPELATSQEKQLVPDSQAVDMAIKEWSNRVRESLRHGDLTNEARMHSILYRFAQLNFAYEEIYGAVKNICSTEDGLKKFLSMHAENNPFNTTESFGLVEDANFLADRIRASKLNEEYSWLASLLTSGDNARAIEEQATRLKGLRRSNLDQIKDRSRIPS